MRWLSYVVFVALGASLLMAGTADMAGPVTVTIMAESRAASFEWQTEMVERFEAVHPNIKVELVPGSRSKMQTMLAGGVPLDMGHLDPNWVIDWAKTGILEDLTPYLEKEKRHYQDWYPVLLDLYRVRGGIYALPLDIQIGAIFLNKDHYGEAGLGLPNMNWTYDDLRNISIRLRRQEADGSFSRYGLRMPGSRNFVPVIWSYGGDFLDDWADPGKFVGRSGQTTSALEYLAELVKTGAVQDKSAQAKDSGVVNAFTGQRIAMGFTNTIAMTSGFYGIKDFAWDVMPLPKGPAGRVPFINAHGHFLFSSSKCKPETYELLRFLTSIEALERRVQVTGLVPPNAKVFQVTWLSRQTIPANRRALLEDFALARSPWPLNADLFSIIDRETTAAIWGDQAISSALQRMESQLTPLIREQ
jgi:multiple sugar transport system substrate-binding protein